MEGSCVISGLSFTYPTRQACIDTGGVPLSEEYIEETYAQSDQPPITYPPPQIDQVDPPELNTDACLETLTDPLLEPETRALVRAYITARLEGSEAQISELGQQLGGRLVEYIRQDTRAYNGWQGSLHRTNYSALRESLEALLGMAAYEEFENELFSRRYGSLLRVIGPEEAAWLRSLSEEEFLQVLQSADQEAVRSPTGTPLRRQLQQRFNDLSVLAQARALHMRSYSLTRYYQGMLPGLAQDIYSELFDLQYIHQSRRLTDNLVNAGRFNALFARLAEGFLQAEVGSDLRNSYAGTLDQLISMAPRFGRTQPGLESQMLMLSAELGVDFYPQGQLAGLDQLRSSRQFVVGPRNLPREVAEILEQTGFYELVANNLREIIFTPEINEGDSPLSRDAGGRAVTGLRQVEIDYLTQEGGIMPAWMIAALLVHESTHVAWGLAVREELQRSTPNERQAFLNEARFLEAFLRQGFRQGSLSRASREAEHIASMIVSDQLAARAANRVMGYESDNLETFLTDLPSQDFLSSHDLGSVDSLDLDGYPTDLVGALVIMELPDLLRGLDLTFNERLDVLGLFGTILRQGAVVFGRLDPHSEDEVMALMARGFDAIYRAMGQTGPLPAEEVSINSIFLLEMLSDLMIYRETRSYLRSL